MTFPISRDIPQPSADELKGRCFVYPFDRMKPGDSFVIRDSVTRGKVHRAMLGYMKRHIGYRFVIRARPKGGWRCWRLATKSDKSAAS